MYLGQHLHSYCNCRTAQSLQHRNRTAEKQYGEFNKETVLGQVLHQLSKIILRLKIKNKMHKIISAASISENEFILEIGPGIGTMTQFLCEHARFVTAVEIDRNLIPILQDTLSSYHNVDIINRDILKVNIRQLANEKNDGFVINAMHSREGCYTYIKEIIAGKSIIVLASEEKEALDMALNYK